MADIDVINTLFGNVKTRLKDVGGGYWAPEVATNFEATSIAVTQPTGTNLHTVVDSGTVGISGTVAVTGTFWQATQPVSGTVTANAGSGTFTVGGTVTANVGTTNGLALDATLTGGTQKAVARGGAKGSTAAADITSVAVDANTQALHVNLAGTQASVPVTGTFWQATQPVSGTVTANAGTGTFTVSGTVTSNIGTTNGLALDATLTGGTQKAIARGGAKGTTSAADVTSVAVDANTQALHVNLAGTQASVPVTGTFWQATQPVSGTVTANAGSGTFTVDSELPAAAALADGAANPTTPMVGAAGLGFNGTTWDRIKSGGDNASGEATTTAGALLAKSRLYVWNGTTWDRWSGSSGGATETAADAKANPTAASITDAYNSVFNGTTWDRARSIAVGDGAASTGITAAGLMGYNGTTYDRLKSTTANGLQVDVTRVQGSVAVTGTFWQTTQPVSGTVTANAGTGTFTVAQTNIATADYDTGAGTVTESMIGIALPASGGPVAGGTSTNPIRTDPTGTTTQPVSGTFWQATQPVSIAATVTVDTELPAAAALADATANPTTTSAGVLNLAYNGSTWDRVRSANGASGTTGTGLLGCGNMVYDGTNWQAVRTVGDNSDAQATSANGDQKVVARLTGYNGTTWDRLRSTTANGLAVDVTRVQGSVATKETRSATPAQSSVASSASNVALLASNANRLGATFYNDSTQVLYLKLGVTASTTSYSVQMAAGGYYEVPFNYTGQIDGIWASANGNARITELT